MAHDHTTNGTGSHYKLHTLQSDLPLSRLVTLKLCNTHWVQTTVHCKLCHLHFVLVFYIKNGNACTLNTDLSHFCNFLHIFVLVLLHLLLRIVTAPVWSKHLEVNSQFWPMPSIITGPTPLKVFLWIPFFDAILYWIFGFWNLYVGCFSKRKTKAC